MNAAHKQEGHFSVIPEGEKRCIWMDLGVVAYKICDRDFNCDSCPLDIGLRGAEPTSATEVRRRQGGPISGWESVSRPDATPDPTRLALLSRLGKLMGEGNRYFHPKHTWIRVEVPNRVYVGIDGIVATVLGSVDDISLPRRGLRIRRGESCAQIIQGARAFSIWSPLSGRVVDTNEELHVFPDKLILDSMGGGWLCSIEPDNLEEDLKFCRVGDAVFPWYLKEVEWLDSVLSNSLQWRQEQLGQTMYDGGELSRNLRELLPPDEYRHLVLSFIGKPNDKSRS
ncbi:MAG: hypothetical protein V1784_08530 [bacterium]